jgi:hypothetical protein
MVSPTLDIALTIYLRDPLTGFLTLHQQFRDGVAGIDGLFRPRELYLSPDQKFLYVMAPEEQALAIFGVPEPTSIWLAILGTILALSARRFRRP